MDRTVKQFQQPRAAASTAHPAATDAALRVMDSGGNAVDAAIAAQAVICVVMPDAAGLGGDVMQLVRMPDHRVEALTGSGRSPAVAPDRWLSQGGSSVTVPGIVDGWCTASARWGRLPLAASLAPAIEIARASRASSELIAARDEQWARLDAHGASGWSLMSAQPGHWWHQPELADILTSIASDGREAFYAGAAAQAIVDATRHYGGSLSLDDLAGHSSEVADPVSIDWQDGALHVQPAPSQGVVLAMAAQWLERSAIDPADREHALVEATEAAFQFRDVAGRPPGRLLSEALEIDLSVAQHRAGPRGYLHTAGVAVADSEGWVVSSLVSVFDDFGSAVLVPELGFVLNNRAAGFTSGDNAPRASARPVHTLAPAMLAVGDTALGLATPGADGQVQTILQVLSRLTTGAEGLQLAELDDAIARPRWRSQDGRLLIEGDHPDRLDLSVRGHRIETRRPGDPIFGAVVAAGTTGGTPFAAADHRRGVTKEVR